MIRRRHLIRHSGTARRFTAGRTRNPVTFFPVAKSRWVPGFVAGKAGDGLGMTSKDRGLLAARLLVFAFATLALTGCERGMHEMYDQPKYKPLTSSPLWANGNSSRPQVPGTQPYSAGALAGVSSGRTDRVALVPLAGPVSGVDANGKPLAQTGAAASPGYANPLPITPTLLSRGQQRFDIYCAPCHSRAGDGDGMIAERGFPHPPSYHTAALRNAPDSHFYKVISNGYGVMYPYADRISPHDRWAIVAYIRALQLSQHAPKSDLSAADLQKLGASQPQVVKPSPSGRGCREAAGEGSGNAQHSAPCRTLTPAPLPGGAGKSRALQ